MRFRAATYNIHKCRGGDGRLDPGRTFKVLTRLQADVIAIQEFDNRPGRGRDQNLLPADFARVTGLQVLAQPTMRAGTGFHGNLLLSRYPILEHREHDLGPSGPEMRRAIVAILETPGGRLRAVATHLGLSPVGRRRQARVLADVLWTGAGRELPTVLMGDFNEFMPRGGAPRHFQDGFSRVVSFATFPAAKPVLALDRIYAGNGLTMLSGGVFGEPPARSASDHLPLYADFLLSPDPDAAKAPIA